MKYFAIDAVLEMRKRTLMKRIKKNISTLENIFW